MDNLKGEPMTYGMMLQKWINKLGKPVTAGEVVHDLRQMSRIEWDHDCAHCLYQTEPGNPICKECNEDERKE